MVSTVNTSPDEPAVEDLVGVRSRVSWGAIIAGAVIALAVHLILILLGAAVGLSVADTVRSNTLGIGAGIWVVLTTMFALFVGGWATSQLTVGENKVEAVIHAVITWAAVMASLMCMVATGARTGMSALMSTASIGAIGTRDMSPEDWEASARRAGVPQETINDWKQKAANAPAEARQAAEDPAQREAARVNASRATWFALLGVMMSMGAAVVGGLAGAGPSFRLVPVATAVSRTTVRTTNRM